MLNDVWNSHLRQSVKFQSPLHGHVTAQMRKLDFYKLLGVKRPVPITRNEKKQMLSGTFMPGENFEQLKHLVLMPSTSFFCTCPPFVNTVYML